MPDGLPQPQRRWAVLVILVGIAMAVLDSTLVNLALPTLASDFGAPPESAIWVVNAFQLAVLCVLLPLASLGDRLGYRRVYLAGTALFTLASLACALAPSLFWLAAMRFVQGLGAAGMMSVNLALVRATYPRALLGRGIALNSMVVASASVLGPSLAAAVLSVADWPWLFAVNVPVGLWLLWMGAHALPDHAGAVASRVGPLDVVLNVLTFGLVFLGVDALATGQGAHGGWLRGDLAAALLVAGLLVGAVYVRRQLVQATPLLPLDLLRIRVFALSMCTSVSAFSAQMLAYVSLPFLFLDLLRRSHWETGLLMMAWPVATIAVAPFAGRLIGRVPAGLLGGLGLGTMSLGLALLAVLPDTAGVPRIVVGLLLCGAGFGLFQSPNNHTIVTSAPAHRSGGAGGMQSAARLTGHLIGAMAAATVFSLWPPAQGHGPFVALGLAAGLACLAGAFSLTRLAR
ncbi:MFS transporter [Hydrogenophaga sp. T2]|uniref:MFS transporter n=1 Tax=Hydrogenophaga sp. T2 TaxID=3132823 RepID=UPI003CE74286